MLLIGAGSALCALLLGAQSSWPALVAGYAVIGAGVGLVMPTLAESAMGSVPAERGGMAGGAITTARQLGFAIGIAVLGTVFAGRAEHDLAGRGAPEPEQTAHALAGGQAARILGALPDGLRDTVDRALHAAAVAGLDAAFLVSAGVGLAGGIAVLILVRPAPRVRSDDRPAEHASVHQ
jgi:hypothetical protein